jgi:hypothetical protein
MLPKPGQDLLLLRCCRRAKGGAVIHKHALSATNVDEQIWLTCVIRIDEAQGDDRQIGVRS